MHQNKVASTENKHGFTYNLSPFGKAFVEYAKETKFPLIDIGAAFGVATLPALEMGAELIAVDIEPTHLEKIRESVPARLAHKIKTIHARFPNIEFESNTIGGVYMSQVLPFLKGKEIEEGIKKIYNWLVPGGKLFVVSFTPYIDHVSSFIPIYEERKSKKQDWPGYINDLSKYSSDPNIFKHLPNEINHIDDEDLKKVCVECGFVIEKLEIFGDPENILPKGIKYDGRERVGLIASKA